MRQDELRPPRGAKRSRKRIGRGDGSGRGTYSGRGIKGQKARSGPGIRPNFEGGQLPLAKALPSTRGFTNIFKKQFSVVNLNRLATLEGEGEVTPERMAQAGLLRDLKKPVKVLGRGEISKALIVEAHAFSGTARTKIEAAGGSCVIVS